MILEFNQVSRQPNPLFEGKIGDQIVISGIGSTQSNEGCVFYNGQRIDIKSTPHREKINGKTATQVTDFVRSGKRIGYVYPDLVEKRKILFFSFGYDYFVFQFEGRDYTIFEVGLGADQHFICVYYDDTTVAIIKKQDIKINFCDKYTIFALDSSILVPMSVLTLYFDCIRYPDHGEIMDQTRSDDSFLTTQRELNEKYDPTFIQKVKELDGI